MLLRLTEGVLGQLPKESRFCWASRRAGGARLVQGRTALSLEHLRVVAVVYTSALLPLLLIPLGI